MRGKIVDRQSDLMLAFCIFYGERYKKHWQLPKFHNNYSSTVTNRQPLWCRWWSNSFCHTDLHCFQIHSGIGKCYLKLMIQKLHLRLAKQFSKTEPRSKRRSRLWDACAFCPRSRLNYHFGIDRSFATKEVYESRNTKPIEIWTE